MWVLLTKYHHVYDTGSDVVLWFGCPSSSNIGEGIFYVGVFGPLGQSHYGSPHTSLSIILFYTIIIV